MEQYEIGKVHGQGRRAEQQDAFGVLFDKDQQGVFAVAADGMGGLAEGKEVSRLSVVTAMSFFDENDFREKSSDKLLAAAEHVNDAVNEYLGFDRIGSSGSTFLAMYVYAGRFFWISIGDSRIYMLKGSELKIITRDHNYGLELDEGVRSGRISRKEALEDPQRNSLISFIGAGDVKIVDFNTEPIIIDKNCRIALMTDGVFRSLSYEEIKQCLLQRPAGAAEAMKSLVEQKGKADQDNYTAIII